MTRNGNSNMNLNSNATGKSVATIQAHIGKLNASLFSSEDRYILSSGRDNSIRLWDNRVLSNFNSSLSSKSPHVSNEISKNSKINSKGLIREYTKHTCNGYNVNCCWFSNDKYLLLLILVLIARYIVTGSEDKKAYIYNTLSGKLEKVLDDHPSVVHLVSASQNSANTIVTSSIENVFIYFIRIVIQV